MRAQKQVTIFKSQLLRSSRLQSVLGIVDCSLVIRCILLLCLLYSTWLVNRVAMFFYCGFHQGYWSSSSLNGSFVFFVRNGLCAIALRYSSSFITIGPFLYNSSLVAAKEKYSIITHHQRFHQGLGARQKLTGCEQGTDKGGVTR